MLRSIFFALFAAFATLGDQCSASNAGLDGYKWDVTEWDAGCARSCAYSFMISGPDFDQDIKIPAFTAKCSAFRDSGPFIPCIMLSPTDDPSLGVSSIMKPLNPGASITVSYRFPDPNQSQTYRNITGTANTSLNKFVGPLLDFTITPTDIVGVA